ncbi:hypothetical protein [Sphingomonas hylomeconis]|uniref:Uncharacterized protein n=1 Tax=Sphingomonas hylomeconis TaxID=1395958 RepID=A0ABV7SX82_9SPHN|nr:hypothetical protein [Sphingomonas hylomeconis]
MRWTALPSPALDAWLAALPDADLLLRGHLVADIHIAGLTRDSSGVTIELEALTIEQ